jgi:hypothetical protein
MTPQGVDQCHLAHALAHGLNVTLLHVMSNIIYHSWTANLIEGLDSYYTGLPQQNCIVLSPLPSWP